MPVERVGPAAPVPQAGRFAVVDQVGAEVRVVAPPAVDAGLARHLLGPRPSDSAAASATVIPRSLANGFVIVSLPLEAAAVILLFSPPSSLRRDLT